MARTLKFHKNDILMDQGDNGEAAYLIQEGWLEVNRKETGKRRFTTRLGPGEIAGELALTGAGKKRTATVRALTDGYAEIIDRGTLIRLVNGPGNRLMPLLSALFARLQDSLSEPVQNKAKKTVYASLFGGNDKARRALCNQRRDIFHLPWVFGAYINPVSVTELFSDLPQADVKLSCEGRKIREHHVRIEAANDDGMQLHLLNHGDFCMLDEERIGYGSTANTAPLTPGRHVITFGLTADPYVFNIEV
ncbi:MAG: cyclic nucleotide-binding domain-containing protein, partial [Mariprofundaceae bacterium]|nr:cyclic nucleotide-binding domain-containing protein [Mariprofundaceae bacterium]